MVLPQQEQLSQRDQGVVDWDGESKEDNEDYNDDEELQSDIQERPTPTITVPNLPVLNAPTGPACVHYVTTINLAPCKTFTPLPLNSDGCAIITSTFLAVTAATAVPEKLFLNDDSDATFTYSYSIGPEPTHHKHRHHRRPKPTITPVPELVPASVVLSPVPQLDDPAEVGTAFPTQSPNHYSYTLSFEFNYGIMPPSRTTAYPELPGPTSAPGARVTIPPAPTSTPSSDPPPVADLVTPAPAPAPVPEPMPPVPALHTTTPPVVVPPPGPTPAKDPLIDISYDGDVNPIDPLDAVDPPSDPPPPTATSSAANPVMVVDLPSPGPTPSIHKACDACADPCVVDVGVVANVEVPLLVQLFQDKIKSALASLRLSLENETGASATEEDAAGVFGKLSVKANAETAGLFKQACETKLQAIQDRHFAGLSAKAEQVVGSTCETGACLQGEVDKTVRLLDFMVSTELARDASQLRVELVNEFRTECANEDKKRVLALSADADATLKKRSGLLGSLLGSVVGGNLDKVVDEVGNVVGNVVGQVSPSLGDLVKGLIDVLTGTVKSVVDSFVGNCNRKGLLDFDTEHGVGSLAAIVNVSLDLFKLVCVKANVDAKVEAR